MSNFTKGLKSKNSLIQMNAILTSIKVFEYPGFFSISPSHKGTNTDKRGSKPWPNYSNLKITP